jgi:hypothetical protein
MSSEHHSPRRLKRRWLFALGALVAALVVAVPIAWASHQFTDVPDSNPFHTEIGNLAGAGITSGKTCVPTPGTPPTFCPNEPVVRQAMAAFLNRGLSRGARGAAIETPIGDEFVELGNVTIDVGGVAPGTQFVKVDAAVDTYISDVTGCPCSTVVAIFSDAENDFVSDFMFALNSDVDAASGFGDESTALTTVVPVDVGTTQTFRVLAIRDDATPPSTGAVTGYASMTAITAAYGSTGSSTLGGAVGVGQRQSGITKRP